MPHTAALTPFRNEPPLDATNPDQWTALERALTDISHQLGQTYFLIVDGKRLRARQMFRSINPSLKSEVIGVMQNADRTLVDHALTVAARVYETWSWVSQAERSQALLRMAQILRQRKFDFIAWLILEVGKNWREADADVAEAIDFFEYYARLSLIEASPPTPVASERNIYQYLPLGVVVVIPPWNFPLAILAGMTAAAIVTGNTVVLKPSSQSPVIAAKFMELIDQAEVPPGVVNLVTGAGRSIGDTLVSDPRTRMIAFTGSKAVGLHINQLAARPIKGQRWIKRVIAEMGGKNAIIVDESADLRQAAEGVVASAFSYQGQKCSACSRAFIHEVVYDDFVARLRDQVSRLKIGPAREPDNYMGPVISAGAMQSILKYIAIGKRQGRIITGGKAVKPSEGFFIEPTVIERLPKNSPVLQEEIFGPVLALAKVKTFEEGLEAANATVYGLTGAVYSNDPEHLEAAKQQFFCGNLYLNRKCTGALVGGHPFGGFNLSGTDSKAGGPDYLLLFRQGQAISQRI